MTVEWIPILVASAALAAGIAKLCSERAQALSSDGVVPANHVRLEIGGRVLTVEGQVNAQLLAALARDLASAPPSAVTKEPA